MVQERVVCPVCFWTRILKESQHSEDGFVYGDYRGRPADVPVIQLRDTLPGPGRGHKGRTGGGFQLAGELSLAEALRDPAYSDVAEGIRIRLINLVRDYITEGVIEKSELE